MKKIQLGHHKKAVYKHPLMYALVDDKDFQVLNQHKWYAYKGHGPFYAVRHSKTVNGKPKMIHMHREIMQTPEDMCTDHRSGNGLDNQRSNLRNGNNGFSR